MAVTAGNQQRRLALFTKEFSVLLESLVFDFV